MIFVQIAMGLYMTHLGAARIELKFTLFQLHKSVGITVLVLSLVRLFWRVRHPVPPLPGDQPAWERLVAKSLHVAFYVFMIGMPITGWIIVSTSPYDIPTVLYGLIPWPDIPGLNSLADKAGISSSISRLHALAGFVLIGAIILHVCAAMKHRFIDRDEVLWRILPVSIARPGIGQKSS